MHVLVSLVQQSITCRLLIGAHQRAQGLHESGTEKAFQDLTLYGLRCGEYHI